MRETEFCIPTSNKAVVSITPTCYDRRALDTQSNYALYSSLTHLANLCQSSPKVRESLACDGGLERLVRILRQGKLCRKPETFQLSKWQQSLLCVVNIGVRGSEGVRNRVIEAGIVPVIVTVLCNALEDIIKYERGGMNVRKQLPVEGHRHQDSLSMGFSMNVEGSLETSSDSHTGPASVSIPRSAVIETRIDTVIESTRHLQIESGRSPQAARMPNERLIDASVPSDDTAHNAESQFHIPDQAASGNEVDDLELGQTVDLLPSMSSAGTIPTNGMEAHDRNLATRLPSISRRLSRHSSRAGDGSFSDSHASRQNPSATPNTTTSTRSTFAASTADPSTTSPIQASPISRTPTTWDQDVIFCLRLLAYLSKYPYLRPDFCKSHDIPQLRQNFKQFELHYNSRVKGLFEQMDEDLSDSLQIPFNVFQLVEKFTMRIHAQESTYWAGVIMRNSCRRHESGGVRQCAYLECGKWETQNKQFAKCRRCRRTKYCSKACQSRAWTGHRYWCSSSPAPMELQ